MMDAADDPATCPICGSTTFEEFRGRPKDRCAGCGGLLRTRSAWLLLQEYGLLQAGTRMAHFAPEKPISRRLRERLGQGYEPFDLSPKRYPEVEVRQFDLCNDLGGLDEGAYDVVMHNHVLEHLPCNYTIVLQKLHSLLKPGGLHVFSVPISPGYTASDLDPAISKPDRVKRFGQHDHLRRFGRRDFDEELAMIFPELGHYDISDHISEETLRRAAIPKERWNVATGKNTVFCLRR